MVLRDWEIEGTMAKAQRDALLQALEANDFRPTRAAAQLRIGRSTIYRLMKRYGLAAEQEETEVVFDGENYVLVRR